MVHDDAAWRYNVQHWISPDHGRRWIAADKAQCRNQAELKNYILHGKKPA